jgi:superfamily I DNA/RNA helicase
MEKPHIPLLKAFDDLQFNLGKKTLVDFIKGDENPTIDRNNLDELNSYGCLYMIDRQIIFTLIDNLIKYKFLEIKTVGTGFQVIKRTSLGVKEIFAKNHTPNLEESNNGKISKFKFTFPEAKVTDTDKTLFTAFDFFLGKFNDKQKKTIITQAKNVLCIAGAGSGKTTVLTKRIEFLTKFKGVSADKVLAITFTRKAKQEMESRLYELGLDNICVETFNSYCEKKLKKYGDKIYDQNVRVIEYKNKISLVSAGLKKLGVSFDTFYDNYFNKRQLKEKSRDELFFIFVNDVFSVIDYYKNIEQEIKPFYDNTSKTTEKRVAKIIHDVAIYVEKNLKKQGVRDFSDQVIDCLKLFRLFPDLIPEYDHILVDEFQDVNLIQNELIKVLNAKNLFVVGDPRQAIYGWRGSEIKFILDFPKTFIDTEVIFLETNYRSEKNIVSIANQSIKEFGLPDMKANKETEKQNIYLIEQDNEKLEKVFVIAAIKSSKNSRNEIFVLARTNRVLENYAQDFKKAGILYTIKSEEEYKSGEPKENEIVLATIHSIKGMEAKEVYIVSCNSLNFPNKVVDNFVFAMVKQDNEYDKLSEELRLFYVAITRAKEKLVISYTGHPSKFITDEMKTNIIIKQKNKNLFDFGNKYAPKTLDTGNNSVLLNMLKDFRANLARETGLPSYMIMSNQALEDLAQIRPSNKAEMIGARGMGSMKVAKYGDAILKVING